jgi:TP901 family phage tail tape measure protein
MTQNLLNTVNATGKFNASIKTVKTTTESFTNALEKNKLSFGEYFRYAGASSKSFGKVFKQEFETINKVARERVKDLQTQYIQLGRDANGAMRSIAVRPLTLDMDDLATKTAIAAQKQQLLNQLLKQGSTNLLNFGKNTQWAGRQLMVGFTIPLGIVGSAAAKTFMQMEEQAIKFKRVYGDSFTPSKETDMMLEQIKELAGEFTKYGVAITDTMDIAAKAAATGKMGADLTAQVAESTRLAVLGGVEQSQALETTISLTNAFGTASDELRGKINFLNAVENQTVTSIEDLTVAIPKAGPVIQQLGGDVEDLAFFLTAMREGGINASESANALKSGLAAMINPTGKAADMLKGFGINLKGIVESNKGDVKSTVVEFAQALDTLDPLDRARAIEQLFGKFQFARISTLFKNVVAEGSQANRVLQLTNSSSTELAMLANKELGRIEDSPMYKFQKAIADFQAQLAPVGEQFLKAVTPVIEFGTKILESFNKMDEGVKSAIINITGIVAGLGPVFLMTFGLIANGVANVIKGFAFIKNVFNRASTASTVLGETTNYMTQEQLEAAAVAASLEQSHNRLTQAFSSERGAIDALTAAYKRATVAQQAFRGPIVPGGPVPKPKGFANGGMVMGPGSGTSDSIPAMVSNGEFIVNAKRTKQYLPLLQAIAEGKVPGFKSLDGGTKISTTDTSVSGGTFEQKAFAKYAPYLPGNTATSGGDVTSDPQRVRVSILGLMKTIIADTRGLRQTGRNALIASDEMESSILTIAETWRTAATQTTKIEEAGAMAYAQVKKQLAEMVSRGEITLRQAGEINSAYKKATMPAASQYTDLNTTRRNEFETLADGTTRVKRSVPERSRKNARAKVKQATNLAMAKFGMEGVTPLETFAHIAPDVNFGTARTPAKVRKTGSTPGMADAISQYLDSGSILREGQKLELDKTGRLIVDGVATEIIAGVKTQTKTNSPSLEADSVGQDIGQGFIDGGRSKTDEATQAGKDLAQAQVNGARQSGSVPVRRSGKRVTTEGTIDPTIITQSGGRPKRRRVRTQGPILPTESGYIDAPPITTDGPIQGPRKSPEMIRAEVKSRMGNKAFAAAQAKRRGAKAGKFVTPGKASGAGFIASGALAMGAGMVGGPAGEAMGAASGVLSVVSMFGGALSKIVPILVRFAGPIGMAIGAITLLVGVVELATRAERERVQQAKDMADATKVTTEKMKGLGDFFGVTVKDRGFFQRPSGAVDSKGESIQQSAITELKKTDSFKKDFKSTVDAVKNGSAEEAKIVLQNLQVALASDFAPDQVSMIVEAIKQEAKKTDVKLDFSALDFSTKEGAANALSTIESSVQASARGSISDVTGLQTGATQQSIETAINRKEDTSSYFTEEEKAKIQTYANTVQTSINTLNAAFVDGKISQDQYREALNKVYANLNSQTPVQQAMAFDQLSKSMLDAKDIKIVDGLSDQKTKFDVLTASVANYGEALAIAAELAQLENAGPNAASAARYIKLQKKLAGLVAKAKKNDTGGGGGGGGSQEQGGTTAGESKKISKYEAGLKLIDRQEKAINEKYDKRIKALDAVAKANAEISQQQRDQLDLADALSRGDIAAAARAAQTMRANEAQANIDREKDAMERARQAEIDNIKDPLGRTKATLTALIDAIQAKADTRDFNRLNRASGGMIPKYFAAGGSPLGTDIVPAMLTPGEFVVKKSAVDGFGAKNLKSINDGTYSGESVYNYSINVNVSSNASADAIARTVMTQIKNIDSQRLRGNRI